MKNNAWVTVIGHEKGDLPMIITSDEVTGENYWQTTSLRHHFISYTLFYVLNIPFCYKQTSFAHFPIVAKDGLFWLNIVTSSELICDVTRTRGTGIVTSCSVIVLASANRMAWQWAENLVEIRGTLADIRGSTK